MADLTPKQARFVEEYMVDLNATQAAIRAGYSEKTAHAIGRENIHKPTIASAIAIAQYKIAERTEITTDMVLQGLLKETGGKNQAARISAWSWIGRHLAMFTDKVQHGGELPSIKISVRPEGEPVNRLADVQRNGDSP